MEKGKFAVQKSTAEIPYESRRVHGDLYVPEGAGRYPAVILSHGYNGCGTDFAQEGEYFASHGFLALAIDFCGGSTRSRSSGASTEMSVRTETEDLCAVLDFVEELPEVDAERIFLFGGSQGGLVSALAAARRESEVRGLVMYYPAFCIPDDWKRQYPESDQIPETTEFWGLMLGAVYFRDACAMEPYGLAGAYHKETLIIHGDEDEIVPLSYSTRLQETYERARLLILPQEKHGFSEAGGAEAAEAALCFLRRQCRSGLR